MKNRVLRSTLVVILVIAMVLTMAACDSAAVEKTPAPVVTSAPATETPEVPTEAPVVTETPDVVVDSTEETLNKYGITFPDYDGLVYTATASDIEDDMSFGVKFDLDNIYQEAYEFNIKAVLSGVTHDGSSISSSKLVNSDFTSGRTLNWSNLDENGDLTDVSKLMFTVAGAGVYTVEYTITVEHDKDFEYGYYAPGEVEEKYTFTKTYTVEKAELELETSSDAYLVQDKMFFVDSTISLSDDEKLAFATNAGYSTSVAVTACDGTSVGAYVLAITIFDKNGDAVNADEIVLDNYYVTVSEGTRYILSDEDIAKVNAVRQMAAADSKLYTTAYSIETITYYNNLTDGQKQMASVSFDAGNKYYDGVLVINKAVTSSDIAKAVYNMERDGLVSGVEDAIKAYMTASTSTKKAAALKTLCELILSIDNTAHKYGSDLLYVLSSLVDGGIELSSSIDGTLYSVTSQNASDEAINIVQFEVSYDSDDKTYEVDFGYLLSSDSFAVNKVYDGYVTDYLDALKEIVTSTSTGTYDIVIDDQEVTQKEVDALQEDLDKLVETYNVLINYQYDIKFSTADNTTLAETMIDGGSGFTSSIKTIQEDILAASSKILTRWDAYIALIEAYGFEKTYMDNADKDDLAATYMAMYALLGYSFENGDLGSEKVYDADALLASKTLSNALLSSGGEYATPDLFVDGVLAATESLIQVVFTVQDEVKALKTDLIQYLVSTGEYEAINADTITAGSVFATVNGALLGESPVSAAAHSVLAVLAGSTYASYEDYTNKENAIYAYASTLADINAYIDAVVAGELLVEDSSFYKDMEKKGLAEAMTELFGDLNDDTVDRIKDMVKGIDNASVSAADIDLANGTVSGVSASTVAVSGVEIVSGDALVLGTDYVISGYTFALNGKAATDFAIEGGKFVTTQTLASGDVLTVTVNVEFIGEFAFVGTVSGSYEVGYTA